MSSSQPGIKKKPNFFLAFKIDDILLINTLEQLQNRIIQESYKNGPPQCPIDDMTISLDKMHVTGILLTIANNFMLQGIIKVIQYCAKLLYIANLHAISLTLRGLSQFDSGRVVFVGFQEDLNYTLLRISLKFIYDQIKKEFPTALHSSTFEFEPHLTIFKAKRYCRTKVARAFFRPFENEVFGTQVVSSFDLLGMEGAKEGYYVRYATMRFDGTVDKGQLSCKSLVRFDKEILDKLQAIQYDVKQLEFAAKMCCTQDGENVLDKKDFSS
jgi:2'-5' RNA ligase